MLKRSLIFVLFVASVGIFGAAQAVSCVNQNNFNAPPPEYATGTYAPQALGYTAGTGLPNKAWIGAYYQDGYWYVDLQNSSAPTVKVFMNYEQKEEHRLLNAKIVGGANPGICVHGRTFGQWPMQESGDGCLVVSNGQADECTFVGGTKTGTQKIPIDLPSPLPDPSTEVTVPVDLMGGYVAAAERWAIYRARSGGGSTIVVGSSIGSAPGGLITFTPGVRYYACVGVVNTALAPASACSPRQGALFAAHL